MMNIRVEPSDKYVLVSLTATDLFFIQIKSSISSVTQSTAFISVGCMRKMKDHQTCLSCLTLLLADVDFAY